MPSKITFVLRTASKRLLKGHLLKNFDKSRDSLITGSIIRNFSVTAGRRMRFVQYKAKSGGPQRLGAQLSLDGDVFDISAVDSSIPNSFVKFLAAGDDAIEKAKRIVAAGKSVIPLNDVTLLSPITKPDKVACVGLNYSGHCDEQNLPYPKEPMIFSKFSSCIVGPYDNIQLPHVSDKVDWEVELAVVIGKQAKAIRPDQVEKYIFGYTVAQDISARDWQKERNNGQFLLGKSMDTFCPIGPAVVTRETVNDPNKLAIKSWVNGKLKQNGNTSEMIFKIDFLVSYLSQIVTLYPGDLILTGTPSGVGMHRSPPQYLKSGDVLDSEIEGIGKIVASGKSVVSLNDVTLLTPIIKPDKVVCVGMNYKKHCDDLGLPHPKEPIIFSKFSSVITGPYDEIKLPQCSSQVDWEVEMAVVIGKQAKSIRPDQAEKYIFGYTVAQDISARDWLQPHSNGGQYLLGKTMDTFCPIGPAVVTRDTINDPHNLAIKSWVNGELKQNGNTSDMIFKIDFLVSHLSQIVTLYPGDLILTGTPSGVGMHQKPPQYLKEGDVVESEIEGIGKIRNIVV